LLFLGTIILNESRVFKLILLLAIHSATDLTTTLVIILGTGILGAALARREGLAILHRLSQDVSSGGFSGHTIVDGTLVAVGGILLLTPGVLTDILVVLGIKAIMAQKIAAIRHITSPINVSAEADSKPLKRQRVIPAIAINSPMTLLRLSCSPAMRKCAPSATQNGWV
jgi:UPF0716 protein FxsA